MKFFTLDWWHGIQADVDRDPFPDYEIHFDSIRHCLPQSLIDLHNVVSLHDANVKEMTICVDRSAVQIVLQGCTPSGGLRRIQLDYSDVTTIRTHTGDPLGGPSGFGDLGYAEVDLASAGRFEHDLLFSSGIELQITAADLRLTSTDQ